MNSPANGWIGTNTTYHFYRLDKPLCGCFKSPPGFSFTSKAPPKSCLRCKECERLRKQAIRVAEKDGPRPEVLLKNQIKTKTKEARAAGWLEKGPLIEQLSALKRELEALLNPIE